MNQRFQIGTFLMFHVTVHRDVASGNGGEGVPTYHTPAQQLLRPDIRRDLGVKIHAVIQSSFVKKSGPNPHPSPSQGTERATLLTIHAGTYIHLGNTI